MKSPPRWTEEQLTQDSEKAISRFRDERLVEPLEKWKSTFDIHLKQFRRLFDEYGIENPSGLGAEQIADIFRNDLGDALRYIPGPPISEDDLKILAETSVAPGRLAEDNAAAERIADIISRTVDPRRFPWIREHRAPTEIEKASAVLASAALITAQRVSTARRNESKTQEAAVKAYLRDKGFIETNPRKIQTLADAPQPGEYCGESMVGSRKADIPVRLFDGRLMPIECKISNSSTNSVKRLNNDAQVKAYTWHLEFGINQVVPVAVLSGVFKVRNLLQAQDNDLTIFWAHRLGDMWDFIAGTKV